MEPHLTLCHQCDRGGLGNAEHKCACGWRVTKPSSRGCYLGTAIVGIPRKPPKRTRSQQRYQDYLRYADVMSISFREFLKIHKEFVAEYGEAP